MKNGKLYPNLWHLTLAFFAVVIFCIVMEVLFG